ncbi:MAG: phage/plasmid primase, P4 family [Acidimicrobiia bacterium]
MGIDKQEAGPAIAEPAQDSSVTIATGPAQDSSVTTDHQEDSGDRDAFSISIFPQHRSKLIESGVSPVVARERGYVSADNKAQLGRYGFSPIQRRIPALIIPIHGVDGGVVGYQIRPDHPRQLQGRPIKYETKANSNVVLDAPPRVRPHLADPDRPLIITEGPIKADSATSHDLDCIALLGVWSWKGGRGKVALPDWDSVALDGRSVYVCFDSDVMVKAAVSTAMKRLGEFLIRRGVAEVAYIYLPGGDEKVGLDDWLAAGNNPSDLYDLCDSEIRKPAPPTDRLICLPPTSPMPNARLAVDRLWRTDAGLELRYWRGGFSRWEGTYWPEIPKDELRATFYELFENAIYLTGDGVKPFDPNRYKLADLLDAAMAVTLIPESIEPPAFLQETPTGVLPSEMLPVKNGLLHLPTRRVYSHTPDFFNEYSLPYDYEEFPPTPARWLEFLHQLWDDDEESIATLQDWFGYCVVGDTSQHKIMMLLGPIRAGKGTIARILKALVGYRNVTGPTLASFATNFGLADLVGKPVAIISDARMPNHEGSTIVERLLSISGEDTLTVDRKYRDHWTGKLPTRFTILTNEMPGFFDSSGAIASRFLVLRLVKSFYNREDPQLTSKLLPELSGILGWALEGWTRLEARGYFIQPASSMAVIREMADLASPVGAFLRDRCIVGAGYQITVDDFWKAWKSWCEDYGRRPGTRQVLGRDLRAQIPEIEVTQSREGKTRIRMYEGVRLRGPDDDASPSRQNNDVDRVTTRATSAEPPPGTQGGTQSGTPALDRNPTNGAVSGTAARSVTRSDALFSLLSETESVQRSTRVEIDAFEAAEAALTEAGLSFTEILCTICGKPGPDATYFGEPVHARCPPGGKVDPW